LHTNYRIR